MKKLLLVFILGFTQLIASNIENIKELQNLPIFQQAGIKVKKILDVDSLYIVNVQFANGALDTVFITKDKKFLFTGDGINTNNGTKLFMPIDMSILKGKEAFTFGNGSKELVLFTDTQCPYCKKFESYFKQIEDKVKIHIFFFPLGQHTEAFDLSMYIMSQKTKKDKIKTFLTTSARDTNFINRSISKNDQTKLTNMINEQIRLGQELGVQGTPMLFDMNGNKVNWVLLLQSFGIQVK